MNGKFLQKAQEMMNERFGHDTLISFATMNGDFPELRTVNTYYENGAHCCRWQGSGCGAFSACYRGNMD